MVNANPSDEQRDGERLLPGDAVLVTRGPCAGIAATVVLQEVDETVLVEIGSGIFLRVLASFVRKVTE